MNNTHRQIQSLSLFLSLHAIAMGLKRENNFGTQLESLYKITDEINRHKSRNILRDIMQFLRRNRNG